MTRRVVPPPPAQAAPAEPVQPPVPWARQGGAAQQPITGRVRRAVQNLPDWEPLPPGEILVQRHRDR